MAYSLKKNLDNTKSRPAIFMDANNTSIKCLIDTGADTPVWTSGEELLLKAFPDAEIQKDLYFDLGGFGRENAPLFEMSYNKIEYEIRPILKNGKSNVLDKIYSFAQND